jgi:hypothetical protein
MPRRGQLSRAVDITVAMLLLGGWALFRVARRETAIGRPSGVNLSGSPVE